MLLFGGLKQHEYSIFTPAYILLNSANFIKYRPVTKDCVLLYWVISLWFFHNTLSRKNDVLGSKWRVYETGNHKY